MQLSVTPSTAPVAKAGLEYKPSCLTAPMTGTAPGCNCHVCKYQTATGGQEPRDRTPSTSHYCQHGLVLLNTAEPDP